MVEDVTRFTNASLYVGDLDSNVTESDLYEKFSSCGQIMMTKICRDKITKQSLGYAYVNFSQPADAERALDTLNFEPLNGKPMRIMWSQRDPSLRKSGVGNVFIKNLDKSIDNKQLYDTFSTFGNIISCKIMCDETGSKGYGFVHFETQEAAEKAINSVNNMSLNGKIVFVGRFVSKNVRDVETDSGRSKTFTNVYVKNLNESIDEVKLGELFAKFGELTSVKIKTDSNGKSLGFGFVNFREPDDALRAVKEMHEFVVNERQLYVSRFQKKSERSAELKKRVELRKLEKLKRFEGLNLFVKNLDDKFDDERLRAEFAQFGTITSAKVMTENGVSKGFGFVCYSQPEEAIRALSQLNGRIIGSKPLYIALAQRKEDRRQILTAQFRERLQNAQFFSQQQQMQNPNPNLFYSFPNGQTVNNPALLSRYVSPTQVNASFPTYQNGFQRASVPRWQTNNTSFNYFQNQQNQSQQMVATQQQYATNNTKPQLNTNVRNVANQHPKYYSKFSSFQESVQIII